VSAVLAIEELVVAFGAHRAVDGLSLTLDAGEVVALVGESGSGKSLAALALVGLTPRGARVEDRGLWFRGARVAPEARAGLRGRHVGFVFQDVASALTPTLTVGAQLAEVLEVHRGLRGRAARARAEALLAEVGIPDAAERLDVYPGMLSGGLRQRVLVALALAGEPSVLVADEPTTALDATRAGQLVALLRGLAASRGLAVLFVSHDLDVVGAIADRVVVAYAGRAVESGPAERVLVAPRHPYTAALAAARPRLGDRAPPAPIPGTLAPLGARPSGCAFRDRCPRASGACVVAPPLVDGVACHHPRGEGLG
jgi:oligopeptide/dipeptide ABC transporter ATP-binding protein